MGIDRKTVSRWISGRTQRISKDNLTKLCDILEIGESTIIVGDRLESLGTREDRWEAARRLHEEDLVEIVGPSDNWILAESLVKSTIDPDMPPGLLSKLYLLLARVYHHLRQADDFQRSAEISMRYAQQASDEVMVLQARLCMGTASLMVSRLQEAAQHYKESLTTPELFGPKALAATLSNLASIYHQQGEIAQSLEASQQSIQAWARVKPSMSHATAWYLAAQLAIEAGLPGEAQAAIDACLAMSGNIRYERLAKLCVLMQADLYSMQDMHDQALEAAQRGLLLLEATPRYSPLVLESAARAMRRAGKHAQAMDVLDRLFAREGQERYDIASAFLERARLHSAMQNQVAAGADLETANGMFAELGASARVSSEIREFYRTP